MPNANPFDQCSEQYGKFRPDYPAAMVDAILSTIGAKPDVTIIDVGAGTGKTSAPFASRGANVISVEPSLSMIGQGLRSYPNLKYVSANAEQLPIAARSADAVICGQAFHWFDPQPALEEFRRVLKPGGHLFLFWNTRDLNYPQPALFDSLIHKWNPGHDPGYRSKDWGETIRNSHVIQYVDHRQFRFTIEMTIDDWIGLSRSISYIQSMGAARLPGFEEELRTELAQFATTDCPYVTELWIGRR